MFSNSQIVFEPNYKKIISTIISEYSSKEDYDNDDNDFFDNINIIFYTNNLPDSKYSTICVNNKYYVSMTIAEIRKILKKCYDANPFSDELLYNIVRYLPSIFFDDMGISFNKQRSLNINNPRFVPNNIDSVIILDDLRSINNFIEKHVNDFYDYELRDIIKLTFRINGSSILINKICNITGDNSYSKFLLKENKEIVFNNFILNNSLYSINIERQNKIRTLYNSTKNEAFLSNDVLYKNFVTRSIKEWSSVIESFDIFKKSKTVLKLYPYIWNLFERVIV